MSETSVPSSMLHLTVMQSMCPSVCTVGLKNKPKKLERAQLNAISVIITGHARIPPTDASLLEA